MEYDLQRVEDISSIRDAMRQISHEASAATDLVVAKIGDGRLDGRTEAVEVRTILEPIHSLSLEVSEQIDATRSDIHVRKVVAGYTREISTFPHESPAKAA